MNIADLPDFDPAEYLKTEEDIAAYLTCILEENDASLLASALGDITKSRGMTEMAKSSGITREAFIKHFGLMRSLVLIPSQKYVMR